MGPLPNIERGVEKDWSDLVAGRVEVEQEWCKAWMFLAM